MRVLTSLADYEYALNSIQLHSLRRSILNVLKEKSDDVVFLSDAKCNLLASEKSRAMRRLIDLKGVLSILEKITSEEDTRYALIKVQPFITHLWNDVDVLISYKDVSNMLNTVRRYFGDVTVVGRHSRSDVTLYIKRLSLSERVGESPEGTDKPEYRQLKLNLSICALFNQLVHLK